MKNTTKNSTIIIIINISSKVWMTASALLSNPADLRSAVIGKVSILQTLREFSP